MAVGTYPVADLPGELECWMGTTISDVKGGKATSTLTLFRRAWDSATSTMREETATWIGSKDFKAGPQRGASEYKLEGPTAKIATKWQTESSKDAKAASGTLPGTVTFTGDAGKWTAWTVEFDMSGAILKTTNTVGADKAIKVTGTLFAGGNQIAEINGSLAPLEAGPCKDEFSKVPPWR